MSRSHCYLYQSLQGGHQVPQKEHIYNIWHTQSFIEW